jgi:hypothetical protein
MSDSQTPNDEAPERDAVVFSGQSSAIGAPEPTAQAQSSDEASDAASSAAPHRPITSADRSPAASSCGR